MQKSIRQPAGGSKTEFQNRVYSYTLNSLRFISTFPEDKITKIIINQLIRSLTSIGANIIEAKASNSKKILQDILILL